MLEAATIPVANGRHVRDGIDAQALSEAVDEVYAAATRAHNLLFSNTPQAPALPRGVVIEESDSPDGPFTPAPAEAIRTQVASIGKDGVSARLVSALRRLTECAAFQPDRWNALQAVRPGHDHQRYRAGDVIPREDLDLLRQAEELLHLEEESNPGWDADVTLDNELIVKVIECAWQHGPAAIPPVAGSGVGDSPRREQRQADALPVVDVELSLSEAADLYAELTGTKPDKGNAYRRLKDENGRYTITHIALKARDANRRKGGRKQRQLMSESDAPQQCSKCGSMVHHPDILWGTGHLCLSCMQESRRRQAL